MGKAANTVEDFLLRVFIRRRGCWLWRGSVGSRGYGQHSIKHLPVAAHRFAYITFVGKIPAGAFICHTCDTRLCVRPSHLFVGTAADNSADMVAKDRSARGLRNANNKLTPQEVIAIRRLYESGIACQAELARRYNVHQTTISNIVKRRQWTWL
jgi:HNH endonuclease/Helix-turn-helix domain